MMRMNVQYVFLKKPGKKMGLTLHSRAFYQVQG